MTNKKPPADDKTPADSDQVAEDTSVEVPYPGLKGTQFDKDADPRDAQLAELRRRLAERDAQDEKDQEIARLQAELDGAPPGNPWASVPKVGSVPDDQLDPQVRHILARLAAAEARNEELTRQINSGQVGVSREPAAAPTARLYLANGASLDVETSVPTHHYDEDGKLHRVVFAELVDQAA
jgi:hypothetical protein